MAEDRYSKLTKSLKEKGGVVSAMLSVPPQEEPAKKPVKKERKTGVKEDTKKSVKKDTKKGRKEEVKHKPSVDQKRVKKNYTIREDTLKLLEFMAFAEGVNQNTIVEKAILNIFLERFKEYDAVTKTFFKEKFLKELGDDIRAEVGRVT